MHKSATTRLHSWEDRDVRLVFRWCLRVWCFAPEPALSPRFDHRSWMLARLAAAVSIASAMSAAQVPEPPGEDPVGSRSAG